MKTRFIVNLHSGRASRVVAEVHSFAAAHGADVVLTERTGHASALARAALAEGCEVIVAVGGDGTMNEIASVLTGTPATLGLVPCGSGDGLGRHLGIHGSIAHALEIIRSGQPRLIDTGFADGHPFFTVAGLGFEAEIAQKFNRLERRGFFRYLATSARAFRNWEPQTYDIISSGVRERLDAFTIAVANTNQYGNGARIAPNAQVDDGLLDLCVIPPIRFSDALPFLRRLFTGGIQHASGVTLRRASHFVVERSSPGLIHTDGEVYEAGATVEFSVRPASLRILAPASLSSSRG